MSEKVCQIEGLEVRYHSKEIDDLFCTIVTIRNIGNATIESSDFAPSCPLSISTTGKFLIDKTKGVNIVSSNTAYNVQPLFDLDDRNMCDSIVIAYDYISKKGEITVSLFHTGNISVDGELKEGKILNAADIQKHEKIVQLILFITALGLSLVSLITSITSIFAQSSTHGASRHF